MLLVSNLSFRGNLRSQCLIQVCGIFAGVHQQFYMLAFRMWQARYPDLMELRSTCANDSKLLNICVCALLFRMNFRWWNTFLVFLRLELAFTSYIYWADANILEKVIGHNCGN